LNSCTAKFYKALSCNEPLEKGRRKKITTKTTTGSQFLNTRRRRRRNLEGTKFSKRRKGKERSPLLT
jgi:hypothetical protein